MEVYEAEKGIIDKVLEMGVKDEAVAWGLRAIVSVLGKN